MYTPSLQSLISKYGGKYGISIPAQTPAKADPPAGSTAPAPAAPTPGVRTGDHVTLSPQALEYQKAHTLPTGTFKSPNLFGDFLDALDTSSNSANGSPVRKPVSPNGSTQPFDTLSSFLG